METFDVIVIGAGHNGLAAAAALGARGKRVCVLERSAGVGGMADGRLAHLVYNLSQAERRRLGVHLSEVDTVSLARDGRHVAIRGGSAAYADGGAHPDAAAYAALHARLVRFAGVLAHLAEAPPPGFEGGLTSLEGLREIARLGKVGLGLKRLGKAEMREFLRILLSNVHDLLLDDFSDGPLAGALAADAVRGAYAGPRSPGTVFSLMYRLGNGGEVRLPMGGMGAVAGAFEAAARARGCEIRTGCGVARILVEGDRACGLLLEDGSRLRAKTVLSSAGALATMQMAGAAHFDVEAVRRLRNLRAKGTTAKVNLALSAAPEFPGLDAAQRAGRLLVAPSSTYVERAFNPVKYGETSKAPVIEAVIPSLTDPGACEGGRHVLSAIVSYVPYAPKGGWTDSARDDLAALTIATLETYAPGLGTLVTKAQVLTPADIETMTGAPQGHWHHAEMGIDQILTLRPANGMARYRFGPEGCYLCGASAHPGGDVMGAAGRNAARQLLRDGGA